MNEDLKEKIKKFGDEEDEIKEKEISADILRYANFDPQNFIKEFEEIQFDEDLDAIYIVFVALWPDIDNWENFYLRVMENIFTEAQKGNEKKYLPYLAEFNVMSDAKKPLVQKIVDRMYRELNSDNIKIQAACIQELPYYINNLYIRNRNKIVNDLQEKLKDNNWKIRCITYQVLSEDNLLPENYKLSFKDRLRKSFWGISDIII